VKWDFGGAMTGSYAADWDCWQNTNGYGVMTTQQCGDRYMREIADVGRGIILMHDADYGNPSNHDVRNGKGNTIDMVKYLIDGNAALGVSGLAARGYTFVRLDEVPDIAASLGSGGGGGGGGTDAGSTDSGSGTCGFDPTWQQTTYANEWWVEYTISVSIASASLEVTGGATFALSSSYGKWVGSPPAQLRSGTKVVVHAKNSAGKTAQTQPFSYLVATKPVTACGAQTCAPSCGSHTCGDDGCGGSCGACAAGQTCDAGACAWRLDRARVSRGGRRVEGPALLPVGRVGRPDEHPDRHGRVGDRPRAKLVRRALADCAVRLPHCEAPDDGGMQVSGRKKAHAY
jgi:hypothetical protein